MINTVMRLISQSVGRASRVKRLVYCNVKAKVRKKKKQFSLCILFLSHLMSDDNKCDQIEFLNDYKTTPKCVN